MSEAPKGLTPLIQVFDMTLALAFYCDVLGFEVVAASPEVETAEGRFSHWMWLRAGAAEVMLNTQYDSDERPLAAPAARMAAHGDVAFYIGYADIEAAYRGLTARGLRAEAPRLAPYGLRAFTATDPDGYGLVFQETR